ncbi:tail fiber domain-containing protein [bacterium]|nr:tail fiber domain-containing protein [bacterium]
MAFIIKDRVKEGTVTTGTGAFALGGAASTFEAFNSYMSNGDTAYYAVVHTSSGVDEWEIGLGTWNTGNTLTRTTILSSSNSGNAVSFASGTKDIFMTYPADRAVIEEPDRSVSFPAGISVTGNVAASGTIDGRDVAADGTKLDGIETAATADQTASEIRTLVESATDSNVFTDADHSKLNAIEASATADQTASEIRALVESATDSNVFTDADHTKLNAIEAGATADQTKADIEGLGIDVPAANLTGTIDAARLSTATTQAESDDSTKIATTAYVSDKITTLIGGAPSTLNDLNELAAAINDDANYNTTLTTALATKLPLAGGALTGAVTTNSTFDGRNVSVDGTKLDGIEANATADQTAAQILTALKTVDGSGSGLDADLIDGLSSDAFIRSNAADVKSSGDLNFSDGVKATFGASSDLQIYHDSSNSVIKDNGTGDLLLKGNASVKVQGTNDSNLIIANQGGAVTLYNNNAGKIETTSSGVSVTGNVVVSGTVDGRDVATDGTKLDGIESNAKNDQTITAGSGLSGGGTGDVTLSHADTSSVSNSDNSGNTFIQDITFDTYGHVQSVGTGTVSVGNGTLTVQGTGALGGSGTFTANQSGNATISISHDDTSSQASVNGSGRTYIQDVTLDAYGHVTGLATATETVVNTDTTYSAGSGLALSGTTFSHSDTSNLSGNYGISGNTGGNVVQSFVITSDTYGHVTNLTSASTNLDNRYTQPNTTVTFTTVNAGNFNTTSDERAKEDITPITGALDKVQQLGGYSFTLKNTDEKSSGVIAQEVQKVMPELVQEDAEGLLSVQYGNMVGLLIEAIKEQQTQIDELKEKLNG